MMSFHKAKFLPLALLGIAFWPSLVWWFERAIDGSDDPWGIGALILLAIFGGFFSKSDETEKSESSVLLQGSILVYAFTFPILPNLVRASILTFAIAIVVSQQRGTGRWHLGTWALASMTLPWLSSLQFFLGYPLRWITTRLSAAYLSKSGMEVKAEGLMLMWGPVDVWVDAPCSGVKMLWVGVFLASALAFIFRLKTLPTIGLLVAGVASTIVGNVVRASAVFYLEAGIYHAPDFFHDFIGILTFILISTSVCALAVALQQRKVVLPSVQNRVSGWLIASAILAAMVPTFTDSSGASMKGGLIDFPEKLEGELLTPRPLSEKDLPYLKGFPGILKTYTSSEHEVLIRYVSKATRRLHSSTDCYRGLGYEIEPLSRENKWARYRLTKGNTRLILEERIRDENGNYFYDVGAWYWSAFLGISEGPWWSEVRVRSEL